MPREITKHPCVCLQERERHWPRFSRTVLVLRINKVEYEILVEMSILSFIEH